MTNPVISVKEARELLGSDGVNMTDEQIEKLIDDVDELAKLALEAARRMRMKDDATQMAELVYDIYQDKKAKGLAS